VSPFDFDLRHNSALLQQAIARKDQASKQQQQQQQQQPPQVVRAATPGVFVGDASGLALDRTAIAVESM
jgi:hypothetical protein